MKILALLLAFNILVATNGIAISDHFCSKQNTEENFPIPIEDSDNCCHTVYKGFTKQDIDGQIKSKVQISIQMLPIILPIAKTHIDIEEIAEESYCFTIPILLESPQIIFQNFRC